MFLNFIIGTVILFWIVLVPFMILQSQTPKGNDGVFYLFNNCFNDIAERFPFL